jgi:hypothetical protein
MRIACGKSVTEKNYIVLTNLQTNFNSLPLIIAHAKFRIYVLDLVLSKQVYILVFTLHGIYWLYNNIQYGKAIV